jgi:hypothetical protein
MGDMSLKTLFLEAVSAAKDLPETLREHAAEVSGLEEHRFDKTYIEFLDEQIGLSPRGPEWTEILKRKRTALLPYCDVTLVCGYVQDDTHDYFVEIDPSTKTVIHWEDRRLDSSIREKELLDALAVAEKTADIAAVKSTVSVLGLYYALEEQPIKALPYWRRGEELLTNSTAPDAFELACYLHNMVEMCLIPGGMKEEAKVTLRRVKEIYALYYRPEMEDFKRINQLLTELDTPS